MNYQSANVMVLDGDEQKDDDDDDEEEEEVEEDVEVEGHNVG